MDNQPPLVFETALRNKGILRPACQELSIVLPGRGERQHTQRLVARLGELRRRGVPINEPCHQNKSPIGRTCLASRFICRVPIHQVITASGREPELLHSTSYGLSTDTNFSLVRMCTATGFTGQGED